MQSLAICLTWTTGIWRWETDEDGVAIIIIIRGNKRKLAIACKLKAKYFHQELLIK